MNKPTIVALAVILAFCQAELAPAQSQTKSSSGSDQKLVSAVHFILRGTDAEPANFTSTGYHANKSAETSKFFNRQMIDEYTITQIESCKFEYTTRISLADIPRGDKDEIRSNKTVYDFTRLSGEIYYDESPGYSGFNVTASGYKGATCGISDTGSTHCEDTISKVFTSITLRDRGMKAFDFIAENFCAPEEKPF